MEVQSDGSVRVQGQLVQNVLVDSKEFFGQDPKIATKNLPADAVDKVQVFDKKSDRAEFTGIEDGREEKPRSQPSEQPITITSRPSLSMIT